MKLNNLTPVLNVSNVAASLAWFEALGWERGFAWDDDGPSAGVEMLVTITFEEHDGKTVQTFHQTPFRTVERRDSHVGGWSQAFDKQAVYAETIAKEHAA